MGVVFTLPEIYNPIVVLTKIKTFMKNKIADMPGIRREMISKKVKSQFKIKDSKGKEHDVKEVEEIEKEIEARQLIKIAPLFYFCPDNYKVYLIPFTIQFSMTEILQLCAKIATNLEKMAEEIRSHAVSEKPDRSSSEAVGTQASSDEENVSSPEDAQKGKN